MTSLIHVKILVTRCNLAHLPLYLSASKPYSGEIIPEIQSIIRYHLRVIFRRDRLFSISNYDL